MHKHHQHILSKSHPTSNYEIKLYYRFHENILDLLFVFLMYLLLDAR